MRGNAIRALLAGALLIGLPLASVQPVAHAVQTDAVSSLGGCLVAQRSGDVLLLLDQSASLQTTDPTDARVTAAEYLIESLAGFAQRNEVDLNLAVAGFDVNFEMVSGWESVGDGAAPGTLQSLASMASRDTGYETDYWTALEGSRQVLRDQSLATGEANRCQGLVWFTDGQFELDSRSTARERQSYGTTKPYAPGIELTTDEAARTAEQLGRDSLCRAGGLADQIRQADIRMMAIGLQGENAAAQDFGFMQSIATGVGSDGASCGAIQEPDAGVFTLASDINSLLFAFDDFGNPDQPPLSSQRPACATSGCADGRHTVVLDGSIRSVRILAGSDLPAAQLELLAPSAQQPALIRPGATGSQMFGETRAEWRWVSTTAAEILLTPGSDRGSGDWTGVWSLTFVDPSAPPESLTRTNIHVEGDLAPALLNAADLDWRVGGTMDDLQFGMTRRGSADPVDAEDLPSTIALNAIIEPPGQSRIEVLTDAPPSEFAQPSTVDLSGAEPGPAFVVMQLDVTTAPAVAADGTAYPGTPLAPQTVRLPVTFAAPANFPTVAARVDFGTTEGTGPLDAALPVAGPGCVWLDGPPTITGAPDNIGTVAVGTDSARSPDTCLRLADGEEAALPLSLSFEESGNGSITGSIRVGIMPLDEPSLAREQSVEILADLRKPVDAVVRNSLAAGLFVLGTVIPLVLMWLMTWWRARIPGFPLLGGSAEVELLDGSLRRTHPPGPLAIAAVELRHIDVPENGAKKLEIAGTAATLQTTARNPLAARVRVIAPGFDIATSSGGEHLPVELQDNWVLLHNQASGQLVLIVLLATFATDQDRERLIADAGQQAPQIVAQWGGGERGVPDRQHWDEQLWGAGRSGATHAPPGTGSGPAGDWHSGPSGSGGASTDGRSSGGSASPWEESDDHGPWDEQPPDPSTR